ncbi:MAG: aminoacyl-tRNA hydrolase [Cyanobacteria bacterium P01_G01_bin.54]
MTVPIQLIVGLGNPGSKYDRTRHNIGFTILDGLAGRWRCPPWQDHQRFKGLFTEGFSPQRRKLMLLKPMTYMNKSGEAMRAVLDWYKLTPEAVLVVYDDMDLPVGRLRLRLSGSAGGHNGIKSAIAHLGGQHFPRLRVGIGKSAASRETISHVLGKFTPEEKPVIEEVTALSLAAIEMALQEGVEKAMSLYNAKSVEMA